MVSMIYLTSEHPALIIFLTIPSSFKEEITFTEFEVFSIDCILTNLTHWGRRKREREGGKEGGKEEGRERGRERGREKGREATCA